MVVSAEQPDRAVARPTDEVEPYRAGALVSMLQLHWFVRLRWLLVVLALAAIGFEKCVWPSSKRPAGLVCVLVGLGMVNVVWTVTSHRLTRQVRGAGARGAAAFPHALLFANAQVGVDLLLLTFILRFTGGVESPLAVFYLFHMAIGSLLLKANHALLQALWAMLLFAGLSVGELMAWIRPHFPLVPALGALGWFAEPRYVASVITVMGAGVFGTLYFTLNIAGRLDEREADLRRAHDALRRSQVAIFDLQQRRSRFMQTAAHQLKSPLAAIQTLVGLIRDEVVPPGSVKATCEKIVARCREGITNVHELLTLARVQDADPRRHQGEPADVGEMVADVCRKNLPMAQDKKLCLEWRVTEGEDPRAHVDRTDLFDCVANLVENAIKYTPGGGRVSVSVGRERIDGLEYVSVSVSDTGMGIEPEALLGREGPAGAGSVFDAFRRGNNALAAGIPGSGLGLSIVREVVEHAHGLLRARSRPGEGSTFTVMFPAHPGSPDVPLVLNTRSSEILVESVRAERGAGAGAEVANHAG